MRGRVFALVLALILSASTSITANSNSHGADPQGTPCGIYNLKKNEVIAGVKFLKGNYQIYSYNIACNKVLGSKGFFTKFLKQKDKDPLPSPWKYLSNAVGAAGFTSGPGVGFRVQIVSTTIAAPAPSSSALPTPTQSPTPTTIPSPTSAPTPTPTPTPTPPPTPTPTPTPKGVVAVLESFGQFPKSRDVPQKVSFNFGPNADKDFSDLIVKAANGTMELFVDFYQDPRPFPIFYGAFSDLDWVIREWTKYGLYEPYREDDVRRRSPNGVIVNYWGSPQGHLTIILPPENLAGIRSPVGDLSWRWVYVTHHVVHGIQSRVTGAKFEQLGCWGTEGGAEFYGALAASRVLGMDYLDYRNSVLGKWIDSKPKVDLRKYSESQWLEALKSIGPAPCNDSLDPGNLHYNTGILLYERLMGDFGHQKIMEWWYDIRSTSNWNLSFQRTFGVSVDSWYRNSAIPYLIGEYQTWIPPRWWKGVG